MLNHSFSDRCVAFSFYRLAALAFGVTGLACAIVGAVFYITGHLTTANVLHILTVPLIGAGAVLRIRAFFGTLCEQWMGSFEVGRIVGQEQEREAGVRPIR